MIGLQSSVLTRRRSQRPWSSNNLCLVVPHTTIKRTRQAGIALQQVREEVRVSGVGWRPAISVLIAGVLLIAGVQADACEFVCCFATHQHDSRRLESLPANHHHSMADRAGVRTSSMLAGCPSAEAACESSAGLRALTIDSAQPRPAPANTPTPSSTYRALLIPMELVFVWGSPPGPEASPTLSSTVLRI